MLRVRFRERAPPGPVGGVGAPEGPDVATEGLGGAGVAGVGHAAAVRDPAVCPVVPAPPDGAVFRALEPRLRPAVGPDGAFLRPPPPLCPAGRENTRDRRHHHLPPVPSAPQAVERGPICKDSVVVNLVLILIIKKNAPVSYMPAHRVAHSVSSPIDGRIFVLFKKIYRAFNKKSW